MPSLLFATKEHECISNYYRLKNKKLNKIVKILASKSLHCTKRERANAEAFLSAKVIELIYQKFS